MLTSTLEKLVVQLAANFYSHQSDTPAVEVGEGSDLERREQGEQEDNQKADY